MDYKLISIEVDERTYGLLEKATKASRINRSELANSILKEALVRDYDGSCKRAISAALQARLESFGKPEPDKSTKQDAEPKGGTPSSK